MKGLLTEINSMSLNIGTFGILKVTPHNIRLVTTHLDHFKVDTPQQIPDFLCNWLRLLRKIAAT